MDFGIARAVADSAATMTQTQAVIGTAQYLSPEQARGETVDARSDLYSTGCLLFELLTGRPPFTGDSPVAVAYQHVREAAPVPSSFASDVPDTLDRITLKALAKERDSRYSTAAEFRADLEAARARRRRSPRPPSGRWPPPRSSRPRPARPRRSWPRRRRDADACRRRRAVGATGAAADHARRRARGGRGSSKRWLWVLVAIALLAVAGILSLLLQRERRASPEHGRRSRRDGHDRRQQREGG